MNMPAEMIPEDEAAKVARVSASTLARFAEAGYFQVEMNGSQRCYSKRSLASIFGVEFPEPSSASRENVIAFPQQVADNSQTNSEHLVDAVQTVKIESIVSESPQVIDPAWGTAIKGNESINDQTQAEHFRQIIQMHADILSRQEREIDDLKQEREWLRRRIEKLEEKAERDQVLLLSESQTVKHLIQIQAQRKSTMRLALEWFGIIPDENTPRTSIDYSAKPADSSTNDAAQPR